MLCSGSNSVLRNQELFYNLVTRDALLIHSGVAHTLAGPFQCREDAEQAAEALIKRLHDLDAKGGPGAPSTPTHTAN